MNSFDLLRLLSAVAVIFHHTRPLRGEPALRLFHLDFGALGVGVFFVISGYLVTASLNRSASLGDYLKKRLLRIEPALVVSLAFTALVLGGIETTLPLADYLRRPEVYLYVLRNAVLYPVTYRLPGVFAHNPIIDVNPSLWTLRLEFTCYLGLAALGALGLARKGVLALLAILAALVVAALTFAWPQAPATWWGHVLLVGGEFGFLFLAGAFLQLAGRPPLWTLASLVLLATPMWILGLPAAVVILGEMRSRRLPADVSYGLYIYAAPVQQALAAAGALTLWASLALTLPLALASWFLVERPALKLKPRPAAKPAGQAPPQSPPERPAPATTPATRRN